MMHTIIFFLIFGYLTNWKRLRLLPKAILNLQNNLKEFNNKRIIKELSKKLDLTFTIKVQKSTFINGYMPGIPIKPVMVITQAAVDNLSLKELEFLILHEAGHCQNWHTLKDTIKWVALLTLGIILLQLGSFSLVMSIMWAILLAILWIQIERIHEIEADKFALEKGADPKAMISFFEKVKVQYKSPFTNNKLLALLFSSHPHIEKRIKMAKTYR